MERPIGMRLKGGCAAGFRLRGLLLRKTLALCGKVFEAGESVGRLAVGALGGTGSRETQTCFCGNGGMFGAKIKDEDILSLSEIRDCAFLLKPV